MGGGRLQVALYPRLTAPVMQSMTPPSIFQPSVPWFMNQITIQWGERPSSRVAP